MAGDITLTPPQEVVIGEVFPFEKPTPEFVGDSVKTAFSKIQTNFTTLVGEIEEGGLGGSDPTDPEVPPINYIDHDPTYSEFFGADLAGWTVINGTLTHNPVNGTAVWVGEGDEGGSFIYKEGALDSTRYTHVIIDATKVSGSDSVNQKFTWKVNGFDFNWNDAGRVFTDEHAVVHEVGDRKLITFNMAESAAWIGDDVVGIMFQLDPTASEFIIHSIRVVGPNSQEVWAAALQTEIDAELAKNERILAEEAKTLAEVAKTGAQDAAAQAEIEKIGAQEASQAAITAQGITEQAKADVEILKEEAFNHKSEAEVIGRFALYQEPLPNGTWDFDDGTVMGWTSSDATISNVSGRLKVVHTGTNGYVESPSALNFDGTKYSKVVARVKILVGSIPDFTQARLYYATSSRLAYHEDYFVRPQNYETIEFTDANEIYLLFDAEDTGAVSSDWIGSTINRIRFDLGNALPLEYEIDYIYVLGKDVLYPYRQAQASAESAGNAAASESLSAQHAEAALTSKVAAETAATNAESSRQQAATAATTAEGHAATATDKATVATTAANDALGHETNASVSATNAATSATNAQNSASEASSKLSLLASISAGATMVKNPFFEDWPSGSTYPTGFTAWNTATVVRETALERYGSQSLKMTVSLNTDGGIYTRTSVTPNAIYPVDHEYVVLDLEVQLVSGTLNGAGIYLVWYNTDVTVASTISVPLTEADLVNPSDGTYKISKVYQRSIATLPGGFDGYVILYLMNNWASFGNGRPAKTIIWHKVNVRAATDEEIRTFNVADEISASVDVEANARAAADGSIEAKYGVKVDVNGYVTGYGLIASANNGTPTSEMIFLVDKFKIVSPAGGGDAATPKQMFSVGQVNGVSTLVMNGNMYGDGAITTRTINAVARNLINDGGVTNTLAGWSPSLTPNTFDIINISSGPPVMRGMRSITDKNISYIHEPIYVDPYKTYRITASIWNNMTASGARSYWGLYAYDKDKTLIAVEQYHAALRSYTSDSTNFYFWFDQTNNAWVTLEAYIVGANVPITEVNQSSSTVSYFCKMKPNTNYITPRFLHWSDAQGTATTMYIGNITLQPVDAGLIRGERLVVQTVTADKMNVSTLSAISANVGVMTAGMLRSSDSKVQVDLTNRRILIAD